MIGISAAWLIVNKTVPERGKLGRALHRLIELLLMKGGHILLVLALLFVAVQFLRMACNRDARPHGRVRPYYRASKACPNAK